MTFDFALSGRTALVTGAGQGVGRAVALTLASVGADVVVNDVIGERAAQVAEEIVAAGGNATSVAFDVTDYDAVSSSVAAAGDIDILVNNAGNAGTGGFADMVPFHESDPESWDRYLRVNLIGVMHCMRAVLPSMVRREQGRVVTIVSDAGRYGDQRLAAYAAAKSGAAGLCRSVAREVGRYGITVNCVALGTIRTPTTEGDAALGADELKKRLSPYIIRRFGEPDDVAAMVTFLATPMASWITGQTYPVNGGYTLSL